MTRSNKTGGGRQETGQAASRRPRRPAAAAPGPKPFAPPDAPALEAGAGSADAEPAPPPRRSSPASGEAAGPRKARAAKKSAVGKASAGATGSAEPAAEAAAPAAPSAEAPAREIAAEIPAPALPETAPPEIAPPKKEDAGKAEAKDTDVIDRFADNATRIVEAGRKVAEVWSSHSQAPQGQSVIVDSIADVVRTLGRASEFWLNQPERRAQAQADLCGRMVDLWANTLKRFNGETAEPLVSRQKSDKRFADPGWDHPFFDFLRQAHAISSDWARECLDKSEGLDPKTKAKAAFYLGQISSAVSPSNFLPTNPELLKTTLRSEGQNLVRGLGILAEDLEAGGGQLRLRQSDNTRLELGRDMAATPGKVVFRDDLIELLQYTPTTPEVFARPVLVVPPWINKFYILDLNPEKSYVRWMVDQGLTVFVISWVNPDARYADKGLADYMHEGLFAALDAVERATGQRDVTAIGYCVGGSMLAMTLAWMAAKGDTRISSATLFAAQTDFTEPGDIAVFTDEQTIASVEKHMTSVGYLDGSMMATAFNMLRPDDLIWSYVVNNYIRGKEPAAFDLLSWNSDATRMTRANHSTYLRECYLNNNLSQGRMVLDGVRLDLGAIKIPVYSLATKEDHIAPARSVYRGMQYFGGPVRYVLGGSGHIAGVVNPPSLGKYQFWSNGPLTGTFDEWLSHATETKGSWWPDWLAWLTAQAPEKVAARIPGDGALPALGDAPGEYVRVKV